IRFQNTRYDRATGTLSYEVSIFNKGTNPIILPMLLALDPESAQSGAPTGAEGRTEDGRFLVDLSQGLPEGGRLDPGQTTVGRTVSVRTQSQIRPDFVYGVVAGTLPNSAPLFTSAPPTAATVGTA